MASRDRNTVYQELRNAGFTPSTATTMLAIGYAESNLVPDAVGDQKLENAKWGPSYGLFQIRTLKAETGKGTVRDIRYLQASAQNQAKAAWSISSHGRDFSPWSTYRSGAYKKFWAQAGGQGNPPPGPPERGSDPLNLPHPNLPNLDIAESLRRFGLLAGKLGADFGGIVVAVVLVILGIVILIITSGPGKSTVRTAAGIVPGGAVVRKVVK
jgi:hypothetical protein